MGLSEFKATQGNTRVTRSNRETGLTPLIPVPAGENVRSSVRPQEPSDSVSSSAVWRCNLRLGGSPLPSEHWQSRELSGGFVAHVESTCLLDDSGTAKDFTYCVAFNKDLLACWDPEEGKIVPCEFGVLYNLAVFISDNLNENKALLERLGNGLRDCATHTQPFWDALTQRTRPPSVQVAQTAPINTREPVMLACYVWGFYPADVNISWMKNGNFVMPHSIKESSAQTNGDWTYQTVSYLALTPSYGDIYTCVVQHSGTPEPVRQDWTVGLSPIQTVKVSVSAVTLGLGVIIFCLGFFSWRKSRLSSYIPLPGSTYPEGRH